MFPNSIMTQRGKSSSWWTQPSSYFVMVLRNLCCINTGSHACSVRISFIVFSIKSRKKPPFWFSSSKNVVILFRYSILLQRTLHHHLFVPNVLGIEWEGEAGKKFNLKAIEFLSGSSTKIGEVLVLGMITQLKEGKFYLEDPTGTVELDMSQTLFRTGFYAESCFVLAEGYYDDGVFHVTAMGLPPAEEASLSKLAKHHFIHLWFQSSE